MTQNNKKIFSSLDRIIYSDSFRSLQDKTQLFYSSYNRKVRTRLTHSIEVKNIAHRIGEELNELIPNLNLDLKLIDSIALAHDIGHTPFGHIGERTINKILSKNDKLGGLIKQTNNNMRFKHNVNSMRVLYLNEIRDWRILEGVMFHSDIFYDDDKKEYKQNPYDFLVNSSSNVKNEIYKLHKIFEFDSNEKILYSLTLEGQIVEIADEIAQRIADTSDGIKARYFEKIKKIIGASKTENTNEKIEKFIFESFIGDVIEQSLLNLNNCQYKNVKIKGIEHKIYFNKIIDFSTDKKEKNKKLKKLITNIMTNSEDIRESDSRSKYIIRQLFKAYFNDVRLLPDDIIKKYFNQIINNEKFIQASKKYSILNSILTKQWIIDKDELPKNVEAMDFKKVEDYIIFLKEEYDNEDVSIFYDKYIFEIGCYIASLSNSEVLTSYNKIYGI